MGLSLELPIVPPRQGTRRAVRRTCSTALTSGGEPGSAGDKHLLRLSEGIVNLTHSQRFRLAESSIVQRSGNVLVGYGGLGCHRHTRNRVPNRESFPSDDAVLFCRKLVASWAEVRPNQSVCSEKALRMTGGFESTHRSFALTRWLIGVLGPIARAFVLPMLDAAQDVLFRCSVALPSFC